MQQRQHLGEQLQGQVDTLRRVQYTAVGFRSESSGLGHEAEETADSVSRR